MYLFVLITSLAHPRVLPAAHRVHNLLLNLHASKAAEAVRGGAMLLNAHCWHVTATSSCSLLSTSSQRVQFGWSIIFWRQHWCCRLQAVRGKVMTGVELASLIGRMVTALNSREIPSAGSMLEFFNKEVML